MPLSPGDLAFRLSDPDAGRGLSKPGVPVRSLGGWCALGQVSEELHGLFPAISGEDNLDRSTDYRCIFVHNAHDRLPLIGARVSLVMRSPLGADIALGLDPLGVTPETSAELQSVRTASAKDVPPDVSFTSGDLVLGTLPARSVRGVWVRRRAVGGGPVDEDLFVLRLEGDTTE